ncbi:bacterial proteasome activator family protein [Nocardia sp. NBC_01327]|uniref:bacterial proteasome activator family protein n=1 Tax=Nocardia sp. NBC_01327 TaxID=2903593 RepID=UPI002E1374FC|nr:bacterial proteasome activator family protein [Nocardia sp. NBC_01327]
MTQSDGAPESIVVFGPEGKPLMIPAAVQVGGEATEFTGQVVGAANSDESGEQEESLADMVEQPAKVMRIGTMIKQLLEEVRHAPLDDASRTRLRDIHRTSIRELEQGLAPELREELERLALPFSDDVIPSDAELRIAQAQLVGWLEGLFHGIQTALFAQQMAARAQLEQMRQLPPGSTTADPRGHGSPGGGQYL